MKKYLLQTGILSSPFMILETEAAFFYYQYLVAKGETRLREREVPVDKKYLIVCLEGTNLVLFKSTLFHLSIFIMELFK